MRAELVRESLMTLTKRSHSWPAPLVAGLLFSLPLVSRADTAPLPSLPPAITAAIDAIAAQPDQCPNVEAIQSLVEDAKSWAESNATTTPGSGGVPALAAYAAQRLQANNDATAGDGSAPDSQCGCVAGLSQALAPVDPAHAADVQQAFAQAFPECDKTDTDTAAARAPVPPYEGLPQLKNLPGFSILGDPVPLCRGDCSAVEPPPAYDASRTAL